MKTNEKRNKILQDFGDFEDFGDSEYLPIALKENYKDIQVIHKTHY